MKKLIHFIFNSKNEKLILIGMPCLAILIAALILIPQFKDIVEYEKQKASQAYPVEVNVNSVTDNTPAATPVPSSFITPVPAETPVPKETDKVIHLTSLSVEKDLYVFVRDEKNVPVQNQKFSIEITFPNGSKNIYNTDFEGCCYLNNLSAGNYLISMTPLEGYRTPATINGKVIEAVEYKPIENIEDIVEIKDINEGLNEIKTNQNTEALFETIIDYINTDDTTYFDANDNTNNNSSSNNTNNNIEQSVTLAFDATKNTAYDFDSNGNYRNKYTYYTSGDYLLDRNGNITDVIPYLEDNSLICGLKYNAEKSCYETVELFGQNNNPLKEYWIDVESVASTDQINNYNSWQTENDKAVYYSNGRKVTGLKNIDGKLYFFDNYGYKAESVGIDVSFYNGNINWSAVKNAGIDFAIIRIGFRGWGSGAIYEDTCFEQNLRAASNAGIKVGVYFYSSAVNRIEAVEEASLCIAWLNNQNLDYPVFIDMEFSGDYPAGRQDKLSPATRVEIAQAFCETIKNAGYKPGIYATQTFLRDEININSVSQYYIWMASYTDNYSVPTTNYRYDMWQFTDFGKVSGVNGSVDFNVI